MARMIPATGPQDTNSRGEKKIYSLLKQGLSEEFTVIHSLPWLASEVKKNDPKYAPTGEIDFLIIHESLGLLTLEIKGGVQRVEEGLFIYAKTGNSSNHLQQMRKNTHGLAQALGSDYGLYFRIGYALVVPDSEFGEGANIPGLTDITVTPQQSLLIDRKNLDAPTLAARIHDLMAFWKKALDSKALGADRMARLVEALCPTYDGTPSWGSRVEYDNRTWLRLTEEQASVVHTVMDQTCMVVTGWPGTGKTLIALEIARRMIAQGKRVLMLTFNSLLADYLRKEVGSAKMSKVVNWHGFCSEYARRTPRQVMTIENLTTFHSEAKRRCKEDVLLLYTAGMPSPTWRAMYVRLLSDLPKGTPIVHWGDVDEGGFRIAAALAREALAVGHTLQPWKMHPDDVPTAARREATPYVLGRMRHFAEAAGWRDLGVAVEAAGFTVEQEALA